jgi:oligopeptide/dipeptide ABC transporter ATP-binding protein
MTDMEDMLSVRHLSVSFNLGGGRRSNPVRDVSFDIPENGRVALVGESGCGKSLTALAIGGLVDRAEIKGEVSGSPRISYVFQNPMQSLNPVMRTGRQIEEAIPRADRPRSASIVADLLASVGLPAETAGKYPCEMSGGQQQRVMIAMALAAKPDLLVADEPTTALDVTTQQEVLDLIARIADERRTAVLLITHNLGLVARYSTFVNVMYAGEIVEAGPVPVVLRSPWHPYTQGLLAAVPTLDAPKDAPLRDIPGTVPPPTDWPTGCAFHPRCPKARPECSSPDFEACPEMEYPQFLLDHIRAAHDK